MQSPKISYNGNISVSQEIVIICICRGGNQGGVFLFVKIYYTFCIFLFSSMTLRLQVVPQIYGLDFFIEVSTTCESARSVFSSNLCVFTATVTKKYQKNNNEPCVYSMISTIQAVSQVHCIYRRTKL